MIGSSFGQQLAQYQTSFLVEEKILASSADSITFSNLNGIRDGGYTLEVMMIGGAANAAIGIQFNGDTNTANYSQRRVLFASTVTGDNGTSPNNLISISGASLTCFFKTEIMIANGNISTFGEGRQNYTNGDYISINSVRYTPIVANISSLSLQGYTINTSTPLAGCFAAGTVIRLYRRINGNTAAFTPLQSNLVADILVPTAVAQVDITGLDGNLHGGYEIDFMAISGATSAQQVKLFYNGDTNTANYSSHLTYGTSSTDARSTNPAFFAALSPTIGHSTCYRANTVLANGKIATVGNGFDRFPQTTMHGTEYTASNLTSMSFVSATANAIGAGSRIRVYRRK